MIGLGTLINVACVLAGGLVGMAGGRFITKRMQDAIMKSLAVCIMFVGISGALEQMLAIEGTHLATKGTAMMVDLNTIQWKIEELGVTANEGASLEFFIKHIGLDSGEKKVNESITYSDAEGNVVVFPDPAVVVELSLIHI